MHRVSLARTRVRVVRPTGILKESLKDLSTRVCAYTRAYVRVCVREYCNAIPNKAPILKFCSAAHNFKIGIAKEGGI